GVLLGGGLLGGGRLLRSSGLLRGGLLGCRGLLALALAAADLTLLPRHVAIAIEIVEVLAVIHLDAGGGNFLRFALGLAGLLPGRGPDVTAFDVVHQIVVALDSSLEDLLTHISEPP